MVSSSGKPCYPRRLTTIKTHKDSIYCTHHLKVSKPHIPHTEIICAPTNPKQSIALRRGKYRLPHQNSRSFLRSCRLHFYRSNLRERACIHRVCAIDLYCSVSRALLVMVGSNSGARAKHYCFDCGAIVLCCTPTRGVRIALLQAIPSPSAQSNEKCILHSKIWSFIVAHIHRNPARNGYICPEEGALTPSPFPD